MPFTPKFIDLVRNFTTVQGTGPAALGAAVSGYTGLAQALSAGDQFYYCIQSVDKPQEREVGRGTLQADGKVAREPVSGGPTSFTGGTKTIALVAAAEWFTRLEEAGGGSLQAATCAELAAASPEAGVATLTQAGRVGLFLFETGNLSSQVSADPRQGIYVAPASDPTGASGAWVRQVDGDFEAHWFGTVSDNAIDDAPAINAALALLEHGGFPVDYGLATRGLHIRAGQYYCASAIVPQQTTRLYGDDGRGDAGSSATVLRFAPGVHGIDLAYAAGVRAAGISLERLTLRGAYTNYASEGEFHGVNAEVHFRARDLFISNFQGDGINVVASSGPGNGFLENANSFVIEDCWIDHCRNGIYIQGADANAGRLVGISVNYNRRWGVWDRSFLGNTHIAHHAAGNGVSDASAAPTVVSHGGNHYSVVKDQESWASSNAPTGTTADNSGWIYLGPGGPSAPFIPAWSSGIALRSGGSYRSDVINGGCTFVGPYAESGQGAAQFDGATMVVNNQGVRRHAGSVWTDYRGLVVKRLTIDGGDLDAAGSNLNFGPASGPASDTSFAFRNTNSYNSLDFLSYFDGVQSVDGQVVSARGFGLLFKGFPNVEFRHGASNTTVASISSSTSFDLGTGIDLKINGSRVVGSRKTGWNAPTGTATRTGFDTATVTLPQLAERVKALLDDLGTAAGHGLIGP